MRTFWLILAFAFVLSCYAWGRISATSSYPASPSAAAAEIKAADTKESPKSESSNSKIDFHTQIQPILQAKCQPCHFSGGQMYQQMPFDRAETVKTLGTKLFTRIKNENHQRLIREFIAQQ